MGLSVQGLFQGSVRADDTFRDDEKGRTQEIPAISVDVQKDHRQADIRYAPQDTS